MVNGVHLLTFWMIGKVLMLPLLKKPLHASGLL